MLYLLTDTHFGHQKMVPYCGRPEDFSERILANLQTTLKPGDRVLHLGDFCIGRDAYWHQRFFDAVRVPAWLVRGNHDPKSDQWYLDHGWQWVGERMDMRRGGYRIAFTHKPILIPSCDYDLNLHGHLHNSNHHPPFHLTLRGCLLSLEFADLRPVPLDMWLAKDCQPYPFLPKGLGYAPLC